MNNSDQRRTLTHKEQTVNETNLFIVFERPIGSKCWTMSKRVCETSPNRCQRLPAMFVSKDAAEIFVSREHDRRPLLVLANGRRTKSAFHIHAVTGLPA